MNKKLNLFFIAQHIISASKAGVFPPPKVNLNFSTPRQAVMFADRCLLESFLSYLKDYSEYKINLDAKIIDLFCSCVSWKKKIILSGKLSSINPYYEPLLSMCSVSSLVLLMTHRCQLRCRYCIIRKYKEDSSIQVIKQACDSMLSTRSNQPHIQFFGGEPLLCFDLLKEAVIYAEEAASKKNKKINFGINTNGILLGQKELSFFIAHGIVPEVSCDGDKKTFSASRSSSAYPKTLAALEALRISGMPYRIIMVVEPPTLCNMEKNYYFLRNLGHKEIQINYASGVIWSKDDMKFFADKLENIDAEERKKGYRLFNFKKGRKEPVALNSEFACDCNGDIYRETGLCLEKSFLSLKKKFYVAPSPAEACLELAETSKFENLWKLFSEYRNDSDILSLIINNVMFGSYLNKRFLLDGI